MKPITIIIIFSFLFQGIKAQSLTPFKINDTYRVNIPDNSTELDTLGQKVLIGDHESGFFMISYGHKKGPVKIYNKKKLKEYFEGVAIGISKRPEISILKKELITIDNFLFTKIVSKYTTDEVDQVWYTYSTIVKECPYTFQLIQATTDTSTLAKERRAFFSSIKITNELRPSDQYSDFTVDDIDPGKLGYLIGEIIGSLIIFGLPIIIIVLIIILNSRKRRNQKNILD